MEEEVVKFDVRMPTVEEVREAEKFLAENMEEGRPKNMHENYARETVVLQCAASILPSLMGATLATWTDAP